MIWRGSDPRYQVCLHAKAAAKARSILKARHGETQRAPEPVFDDIGAGDMGANRDVTDPDDPTAHLSPEDPEFNGDQIISGTGDGPELGGRHDNL